MSGAKNLRMPGMGSVFATVLVRNLNNEQNRMKRVIFLVICF